MSKSAQAAKPSPEPQGEKEVWSSVERLGKARDAVAAAVAAVESSVVALGREGLSGMKDRDLRTLLTEVSRSGKMEAALLVVASMKSMAGFYLDSDEAERLIGIGYDRPAEDFVADGKNTNLADLLILVILKVPESFGSVAAMRALVRAGVRTDSFLDIALASDMQLTDKMAALGLAEKPPNLSDGTVDVLTKQILRGMRQSPEAATAAMPKVLKMIADRDRRMGRESTVNSGKAEFIKKLVSHEECAWASQVAKSIPEAFEAALSEVLGSGSPVAMATFWHDHSARCDRKVFLERMTEAVRPDPGALANAILDNSRYGGRGHPMFYLHPMMCGPIGFGPRGLW